MNLTTGNSLMATPHDADHPRLRCEHATCTRPATHKVAEKRPLYGFVEVCSSHVAPTVAMERKYLAADDITVTILPRN